MVLLSKKCCTLFGCACKAGDKRARSYDPSRVQAGVIVPTRHVFLIPQLYSNGSHPTPLFFLLRDVTRGVTSARVLPDKKLLKLNAPWVGRKAWHLFGKLICDILV